MLVMSENWQDTLVVPSAGKNAERCGHYFAMIHDLDLANMALVRMAQHQSMRGHEDADNKSENIYFDYALMHYFRCFGRGRHALGVRIFNTLSDGKRMEARRIHALLEDAYTLKSHRPDDIFSAVKIGVALHGDDSDESGVKDIFWLMNRFQVCKPELTKAFMGLVSVVKDQVEGLAQEAVSDLLAEARKEGNESLYESAMFAKDFALRENVAVNRVNLAKEGKGEKVDLSKKTKKENFSAKVGGVA